jgi:ParB/RepB/Spo0J family partition protein
VSEMRVHPAADIFPMMSDEELADLAEDIKANGQLHPIVLDADGQLIDGRNRLRACELAEVEPRFTTLNGQDPVAHILSANVTRRHLSTSQKAMAAARLRLLTESTTRGTQSAIAEEIGADRALVSRAKTVLGYALELADAVLGGATPLNEAYAIALERKKEAESTEGKMIRLREEASDLADQVTEESLTLEEALGALRARRQAEERRLEEIRRQRDQANRKLAQIIVLLNPGGGTPEKEADDLVELIDRETVGKSVDISAEQMDRCIATLVAIRDRLWEEE